MNPEVKKIFDNFTDNFNKIYSFMTGKQKREIAYLSSTVFIRWYYSALFPETILSPSTIVESQGENKTDKGYYSYCMHFKYPNDEILTFSYEKRLYSVEEHPIYNDLNIFINYISPVLYLTDDFTLTEKDIHALQARLSVSDRYYVLYLFALAEKLGMYKSMSSLYDICIQPDINCSFNGLTQKEKFDRLVDVSCEICADTINDEFPYELCCTDAAAIKQFLVDPIPIDDIFIRLYAQSGTDLKKIWHNSDKADLDDDEKILLSSVFYMGVIMDRCFIYVFGHYLRLIRPLYSFPVNFKEIINALFTAIAVDGERDMEIFMPCTSYLHTQLGKIYFGKYNAAEKKYPPIPIGKINLSLAINKITDTAAYNNSSYDAFKIIYAFKAYLDGNKKLWKLIEIDGNTNISVAAAHVMMMFMLPPDENAVVRLKGKKDKTFISFESFEMANNATTTINDIFSETNESIIIKFDKNRTIELKMVDTHSGCNEIIYPRIVSQSKIITEKEHYTDSWE